MRVILSFFNRLFFNSLSKQFLFVSVLLIAVFGFTVFFVLTSLESIYYRLVTDHLEQVAHQKSEAAGDFLYSCYQHVDTISGNLRFGEEEGRRFRSFGAFVRSGREDYLESYKAVNPFIAEIIVLDTNGDILFENKYKKTRGQNKRDRDWFAMAIAAPTKQFTSRFFTEQPGQPLYFIVSESMRNAAGNKLGVLAVVFTIEPLIGMVSGKMLGKTGREYIIDGERSEVVIHAERRRMGAQKIDGDLAGLVNRRNEKAATYTNFDGMRVIGARAQLKAISPRFAGWMYVAEREQAEAMKVMQIPKARLGTALLAAVGGLLIVIYLFSLLTILPIRRLSEAARAFAAGDLSRRVSLRRTDEFATLAGSFNHMANELQNLYNRLNTSIRTTRAELQEVDQELKFKQEQLIRSEKLAAMGKLAAGIAHEIRNPLQSIKLFVQSRVARGGMTPKDDNDYQVIGKEVARIEEHITRFVDFARPEKPSFRPISLRPVVEHTLTLLAGKLEQKQIAVFLKVPRNLPAVRLDEKKMAQVFVNLFLNALDAMKPGGSLTVEARLVGEPGPAVEIRVADTGQGIRPADLPTIFDPFVSHKEEGTGLGLSIVHSIIELHKAEIRVESELRVGTTFIITLPLDRRPR